MSDFPPRVENFRELLQAGLPEADFLIEEIWKTTRISSLSSVTTRFWRVTIQAGKNQVPSVVDVPDRLVLEYRKTDASNTAVLLVQRSANLILTKGR
jgi:hypothetical protein